MSRSRLRKRKGIIIALVLLVLLGVTGGTVVGIKTGVITSFRGYGSGGATSLEEAINKQTNEDMQAYMQSRLQTSIEEYLSQYAAAGGDTEYDVSEADLRRLSQNISNDVLETISQTDLTGLTEAQIAALTEQIQKKIVQNITNESKLNNYLTTNDITKISNLIANETTSGMGGKVQSIEKNVTEVKTELFNSTSTLREQIVNNKSIAEKDKAELLQLITNLENANTNNANDLNAAYAELQAKLGALDENTQNNLNASMTDITSLLSQHVSNLQGQINALDNKLGDEADALLAEINKNKDLTDQQKTQLESLINDVKAAGDANDAAGAEALATAQANLTNYINTLDDKQKQEMTNLTNNMNTTINSKVASLQSQIDELATKTNNDIANAQSNAQSYTDTQLSNKLVTMANQAAYDSLVATGSGTDVSGRAITYDPEAYYFIIGN